jgi:hypothetical protein
MPECVSKFSSCNWRKLRGMDDEYVEALNMMSSCMSWRWEEGRRPGKRREESRLTSCEDPHRQDSGVLTKASPECLLVREDFLAISMLCPS